MPYIKKFSFTVTEKLSNLRLDKFLANIFVIEEYELSREKIKQLILQGEVTLNNNIILSPNKKIKQGDNIIVKIPKIKVSNNITATNIPLNVIYEDQDLLVINKQAGLTTHPGNGNKDNTLVNALLAYKPDNLSEIAGIERPGIIHRLDKNTSGLIIIAKNDKSHLELSKQLQERTLKREYISLIWGILSPDQGTININIARSSRNRKLMDTSVTKGKTAITHYQTQKIYLGGLLSLVKCSLQTGRTHQIRVHLSHLGHGIFGDPEYGNHNRKLKKYFNIEQHKILFNFNRQALHAAKIKFQHPVSKKFLEFETELPTDFKEILDQFSSTRHYKRSTT